MNLLCMILLGALPGSLDELGSILGVKLIDRSEIIRLLEMNQIKAIALDEAIFKSYAK